MGWADLSLEIRCAIRDKRNRFMVLLTTKTVLCCRWLKIITKLASKVDVICRKRFYVAVLETKWVYDAMGFKYHKLWVDFGLKSSAFGHEILLSLPLWKLELCNQTVL